MKKFKKSMLERTNIETNKQFQRLAEKTQVLVPQNGLVECAKNRLTHSYETATSALLMATDIAEKLNVSVSSIDYHFSLHNVCLLHDIGQSPFGHDGQKVISDAFIEAGLEEGFDDNSNNLTVIEKNNILVSDYTMVSLIKYPTKLYKKQKERYLPILENAIKKDLEHFKKLGVELKNQKRTIACQIMDEADRNSYVCSDLADFFCLGNYISLQDMRDLARNKRLDLECSEFATLANMIKSGSKTAIKAYFNDLKNRFNFNYTITTNGVEVDDKDLNDYREFLAAVEFKFFIRPKQKSERHKKNLILLKNYINHVLDNNSYPSKTYRKLINGTDNRQEKLTHMRDMIGENTDWYIINYSRKAKEGI
jgi:dGTP triphosphohydrolase